MPIRDTDLATYNARVDIERAKLDMYQQQMKISAQIDMMKQQMAFNMPCPAHYERHAVLQISGEKGSMLLDFDVQVHMEDGEFHSLIIAMADESVTILREEFLRRLEEKDMLCSLVYKRIVSLKLLDGKQKPTSHAELKRGDFVKQGGKLCIVEADGKLTEIDQ